MFEGAFNKTYTIKEVRMVWKATWNDAITVIIQQIVKYVKKIKSKPFICFGDGFHD